MITRTRAGTPRTLAEWATALDGTLGGADVQVNATVADLADDSREVSPGTLFLARRGSLLDGVAFARDAMARGALAVVADVDLPPDVPVLRVADVAVALRDAADAWTGHPQDALDLIAVTGTKGKTTTAWLVAAALEEAGIQTAVLGTIFHDLGPGRRVPAANTTPGVLEIRRLLAEARDTGCRAAVMEVSSHALDQGRVEGLSFRSAVFTNLGRDHLDYHRDVEAYFEAKSRLFRGLGSSATAVLNHDDTRWGELVRICRGRVLTYGERPEADLRAHDIQLDLERSSFLLTLAGERQLEVETPLVGRHNALNLVAAVGAAKGVDVDPVIATRGAAALAGVPGRLERVSLAGDLHVFVDYAHTAEALQEVLTFLREVGATPLTCVVGCGGDRDRTKRPRMARIATAHADTVVLTSDNPRTEDPDAILRDMEAGIAADARGRVVTLPDRRAAIRHALERATPGACVLIAGKGHETYQILGTEKVPFDDRHVAREALARRLAHAVEGAGVGDTTRPGEA